MIVRPNPNFLVVASTITNSNNLADHVGQNFLDANIKMEGEGEPRFEMVSSCSSVALARR